MNIPIIYEDQWLLVLDKPSGLLVIPAPGKTHRTLTGILNEDATSRKLPYRLYPCHRLDRETSGLIIYAKGKSAQQKMMQLFHKRTVKKTYIAFLKGRLSQQSGQINFPIEGTSATTKYKILGVKKNFCVVEVNPITGRTNQIRIHFKRLGHPVLGDAKFALRRDFVVKAKRLCLHARQLEFMHPLTNKQISLQAPLPAYLNQLLVDS